MAPGGHENPLVYVHIPKNASTWTKNRLLSLNWEVHNFQFDFILGAPKSFMIALRDPVERWCSGISEYFSLYHPTVTVGDLTQPMLDLLFDRVVFDDHTEKQSNFIRGLPREQCVFFKVESIYKKRFSNFLSGQGIPNRFDTLAYEYRTQSGQKRYLYDYLKFVIEKNPHYRLKLENYYEEDYNLINSVKFYGSR